MGLKKLKLQQTIASGKRPFNVDVSISIVLLDLNIDLNLIIPYPASQIEDKPRIMSKF